MAMTYRTLADGQRAQVFLGGPGISDPELVFETGEMLIEAPNWSLDGRALYLNGHGQLWRLDLGTPSRELPGKSHSELVRIDFDGLPELNNDHVLDPDGEHIYASAMDGHIYRGALTGGPVQRVTTDEGVWHFLHGVAPDGQRLAYVRIGDFAEPGRLAILALGGPTTVVEVGRGHLDGPEWSPDGRWIYLNTETFHAGPRPRPAGAHPGWRRPRIRARRAAGRQRHGRLVPAPLSRRAVGELHRLPGRHAGSSGRPRRGGAGGRDVRLVGARAALPALRRPRHDQRQQLVTRQHALRLRRLPG